MISSTDPTDGGFRHRKRPNHRFERDVSAVDHIIELCKARQLSVFSLSLQLGQSGFSFDGGLILMDALDKEDLVRRDFFTKSVNDAVEFMFYVHFLREETVYFDSIASFQGVTDQHLATVTRLGRFYAALPYPVRFAALWLLNRSVVWVKRIKSFKVVFTLSSAGAALYHWIAHNSISQYTFVVAMLVGMVCAYVAEWYSKD